mmetsp:Transcript_6899/g.14230  ORF Transcript_6899/g.14230 Transcript_6899/m.14230 type:complete len:325 (+) Transcript_6899:3042-4016(+)
MKNRCRSMDGTTRWQGVTGLNNLQATDYINSVLQILAAVSPLRDFFLRRTHGATTKLVTKLGELVRRMWASDAFRGHISPHDLVQEIIKRSNSNFGLLKRGDPGLFFIWLLNSLHRDLQGKEPRKGTRQSKSIVSETFQGGLDTFQHFEQGETKHAQIPFFVLSFELPPKPLFKDNRDKNSIQQIPLHELLKKFDGKHFTHDIKSGARMQYSVNRVPRFLVFHIQRFSKTSFLKEKNPAVVIFPTSNLDMGPFLQSSGRPTHVLFDLVGAVIFEGHAGSGQFHAFVLHKASGKWFDICDLRVKETMPQLMTLSEARLLIYERQA